MWPERFIEEILRQLEEGKKMGILVDKFVLQ